MKKNIEFPKHQIPTFSFQYVLFQNVIQIFLNSQEFWRFWRFWRFGRAFQGCRMSEFLSSQGRRMMLCSRDTACLSFWVSMAAAWCYVPGIPHVWVSEFPGPPHDVMLQKYHMSEFLSFQCRCMMLCSRVSACLSFWVSMAAAWCYVPGIPHVWVSEFPWPTD